MNFFLGLLFFLHLTLSSLKADIRESGATRDICAKKLAKYSLELAMAEQELELAGFDKFNLEIKKVAFAWIKDVFVLPIPAWSGRWYYFNVTASDQKKYTLALYIERSSEAREDETEPFTYEIGVRLFGAPPVPPTAMRSLELRDENGKLILKGYRHFNGLSFTRKYYWDK